MSDATSDAPLPRAPLAPAPEPQGRARPRRRDTILFVTTALVVAGATAGVVMRHRIEPLVHPVIARFFGHHRVPEPDAARADFIAEPGVAIFHPGPLPRIVAPGAVPAPVNAEPHATAFKGPFRTVKPDHSASAPSLSALLALRAASPAGADHSETIGRAANIALHPSASTTDVSASMPTSRMPIARVTPVASPVHLPVPPLPAKVSLAKAPDVTMAKGAAPMQLAASPAVAVAKSHVSMPPDAAKPVAKMASTAVGPSSAVQLHPVVPVVKPVVAAIPAIVPPARVPAPVTAPVTAPSSASGPATLVAIAHPVATGRHLVAGPMTPKSEIPVLSLVSQLGVLVAQLRDQNLALTQQVAAMRTTMNRRLDSFGRTLNLDQAKSALALAVQPAEAPRAAIHPHIFQSHSTVPAGQISALSYRIEAATPGVAILSHDGHTDEVSVGDAVPGVGRVLAVTEDGTTWVVRTTHGVIR
jgi:hypothetical protein